MEACGVQQTQGLPRQGLLLDRNLSSLSLCLLLPAQRYQGECVCIRVN